MLPLQTTASRFPRPDWAAVNADAQGLAPDGANAFWTGRGREWVHLLRSAFGSGYMGYESSNFWLVSSQPEATSRRLLVWLEQIRKRVVLMLGQDSARSLHGKCPVLITHDLETYYEYVAGYLPEDENAMSGGMFINDGYGHFVFTFLNMSQAESVLAHELTHALVAHLPLPAWLNEGAAQLCEQQITGRDTADYERIKETLGTYWSAATIQDLWSGRGFNRQDEGQMQSYHLAKVLTRRLTGDEERFRRFFGDANAADAGAAAVKKHYGLTLGELVADYLGDGDWEPARGMDSRHGHEDAQENKRHDAEHDS